MTDEMDEWDMIKSHKQQLDRKDAEIQKLRDELAMLAEVVEELQSAYHVLADKQAEIDKLRAALDNGGDDEE